MIYIFSVLFYFITLDLTLSVLKAKESCTCDESIKKVFKTLLQFWNKSSLSQHMNPTFYNSLTHSILWYLFSHIAPNLLHYPIQSSYLFWTLVYLVYLLMNKKWIPFIALQYILTVMKNHSLVQAKWYEIIHPNLLLIHEKPYSLMTDS